MPPDVPSERLDSPGIGKRPLVEDLGGSRSSLLPKYRQRFFSPLDPYHSVIVTSSRCHDVLPVGRCACCRPYRTAQEPKRSVRVGQLYTCSVDEVSSRRGAVRSSKACLPQPPAPTTRGRCSENAGCEFKCSYRAVGPPGQDMSPPGFDCLASGAADVRMFGVLRV